MTEHDDLDRLLSAWLDDPYTPPAPRYLTKVLDRTRRTRQRPAWANLERWLPMAEDIRPDRDRRRCGWPGSCLSRSSWSPSSPPRRSWARGSSDGGPGRADPAGRLGRAGLCFASIVGDCGRHLHRPGGWHGHAPVDQRAWRQERSGVLARRHTHRVPRLAGREDLIVVMDAGGGNRTILATNSSSASYCTRGGLSWSPDGSSLIFRVSSVCDSSIRPLHRSSRRLGTGGEAAGPGHRQLPCDLVAGRDEDRRRGRRRGWWHRGVHGRCGSTAPFGRAHPSPDRDR